MLEDADVIGLLPGLTDLHPREAVQALTSAVVTACQAELEDGATALVLDWYGGRGQVRHASSGATDDRASN